MVKDAETSNYGRSLSRGFGMIGSVGVVGLICYWSPYKVGFKPIGDKTRLQQTTLLGPIQDLKLAWVKK